MATIAPPARRSMSWRHEASASIERWRPRSWTLPSHASMFTGRWPHELSAGWFTPLDWAYPTLAEFLGSRGYATAGFIANYWYCSSDSGLDRGFTAYQDYIFQRLSFLTTAVLVDRPLDGLQAIERVPRGLAGFRSPGAGGGTPLVALQDQSKRGRGRQSRVSRLAVPATAAGAAILRLPELL